MELRANHSEPPSIPRYMRLRFFDLIDIDNDRAMYLLEDLRIEFRFAALFHCPPPSLLAEVRHIFPESPMTRKEHEICRLYKRFDLNKRRKIRIREMFANRKSPSGLQDSIRFAEKGVAVCNSTQNCNEKNYIE